MRRVAVIGAGPSGLTAAKYLLQYGFVPQIFDKYSSVGGMWNPESARCWASMRTNLSSHCCCFSDFRHASTNLFPSRDQIYDYLVRYADQFLKAEHFSFNSEVKQIVPNSGEWVVHWEAAGTLKSEQFHSVVVACGFFGTPYIPQIPNLSKFRGQILHSETYSTRTAFKGKKVVVVGSSHNAAEVSGDIALQAAAVVNIAPRKFWVVPRMLPLNPTSASSAFAPIDLIFYRRSQRITKTPTEVVEDAKQHIKTNTYFRSMVGRTSYSPQTVEDDSDPPFIAISDYYHQMVASQRITTQLGRIRNIGEDGEILLENGHTIKGADALVFCTGYRSVLPFFSADILDGLSFDANEAFMPLLLHRSMIHPRLPGLGFVGMYRGPYFGVIELQSHWIAALFAGSLASPPTTVQLEGIQLERSIKERLPRPQFSHPDYIGLADCLAADLGISSASTSHDFVIPATYCSTPQLGNPAMVSVEETWQLLSAGRNIGSVVLQCMAGTWNLSRKVIGRQNAMSGSVDGVAQVTIFEDNIDTWLYREDGILKLENVGTEIPVHREDIYSFNPIENSLDVFFAQDGKKGKLFLVLRFSPTDTSWVATSCHPCVKDMYEAKYSFQFAGIHLSRWEMRFKVSGPAKDYETHTIFTQPSSFAGESPSIAIGGALAQL